MATEDQKKGNLRMALILASIVAHGLTDTVGTRWIERRIEREPLPSEGAHPGPATGTGAMP